jgi:hypothetical protein
MCKSKSCGDWREIDTVVDVKSNRALLIVVSYARFLILICCN